MNNSIPRTRQPSSIRRIQIIEAAGKIVVQKGSENVTIRALAEEVGVSEAAIYRHYDSKREVWLALVNHIVERLIEDIESSVVPGASSLDVLQAALNKHVADIDKKGGISFHVIANIISVGDKKLDKAAYILLQKYMLKIQQLIEAAMAEGSLSSGLEPADAAQRILAQLHGLVNMWVLSDYAFDLKSTFAKHLTFNTVCMQWTAKK